MSNFRFAEVACDLCGSSNYRTIFRKRGALITREFTVVRCRQCDFIFVNPRVADEDIPKLYDSDYWNGKGFDRTWTGDSTCSETEQQRIPDIVTTCEEAFGRPLAGIKTLDIGCGLGYLVEAFLAKGADAVGLDTSEYAIVACSARGIPLLSLSDTKSLPEESFDVITAVEVIEHIPHPSEFLRELARLLKPGGVLCIGTASWSMQRLIRGTPYVMPEGHIQYFTPVTLGRMYRKVGLVELSTVFNRNWIGWRIFHGSSHTRYKPFIFALERITHRMFPGFAAMPIAKKPDKISAII